jgi:hypothetical protein
MARTLRNISAIVFLITASLSPVGLQAWTCEQQGYFVVGPYCDSQSSCSQLCLEQECFAYAGGIGGGSDCFNFCLGAAEDYCD